MLKNKVKIFYSLTCVDLEQCINDFIEDKSVYDIKFTHTIDGCGNNFYRALIWYCDDEEESNNARE